VHRFTHIFICLSLFIWLVTTGARAAVAQEMEDDATEAENAQAVNSDQPQRDSPWLLTPTFSVDPKLGRNVGAIAAYLHRFDEASPVSLTGAMLSYSNTDSLVSAMFTDLYWGADHHRLTAGAAYGDINNEYDDFLGSGQTVATTDDLKTLFMRYRYRVVGDWFFGGQLVRTNYVIGVPTSDEMASNQVGLMGFNATGVGFVVERDGRNHVRNPTSGSHLVVDGTRYSSSDDQPDLDNGDLLEELLPEDPLINSNSDFDVLRGNFNHYSSLGHWFTGDSAPETVLAVQAYTRLTYDAPISGYSSVIVPGYTRGNYLGENSVGGQFDLRMPLSKRWGVVVFGGVGCLFGDGLGPNATSQSCSDELYPGIGAGVSWLVKPQSGVVVRLEAAKGSGDNSAFYLRFGHPF
jgi:hypothetical protein